MKENNFLRRRILEQGYKEKMGHFCSAFSCVDSINYLYDNLLKENDLFILSKGHGAMALYSVLEKFGKNPNWTEHPEIDEKNGIYATTGSLGHGLPIGIGRALAKKLRGDTGRTYVLVGDGEIQEGSNWEGLMIAEKLGVNLTLMIDWNKYQAVGSIEEHLNIDAKNLEKRLKSFGCNKVLQIKGHNKKSLSKIKELGEVNGLNAVILDTIKGKGLSILEYDHPHAFFFQEEDYKKSLKELE